MSEPKVSSQSALQPEEPPMVEEADNQQMELKETTQNLSQMLSQSKKRPLEEVEDDAQEDVDDADDKDEDGDDQGQDDQEEAEGQQDEQEDDDDMGDEDAGDTTNINQNE